MDQPESKWIGNIPYDVFFDQPLVVATDTRPVGNPAAVPAPPGPPGNPEPEQVASVPPVNPVPMSSGNVPATPPSSSARDWRDILPMAQLVEEVKLLRTRLGENLNTVATYNKSFKAIANDAAVLAALAAVVTEHPEAVSWKTRAPDIRDVAREIVGDSTGTGREKFVKCRDALDRLFTLLDGGTPPAQPAPATLPLAEVAQVADLMQRIESSFTSLKANVRAPGDFKNDGAKIDRETRLLLALGTLIADSSYDSADQLTYQQQASKLATGLREALTAARSNDVDAYQSALGRVQTSCAECHREYRSSNSGF